jgi:hypothetical protein
VYISGNANSTTVITAPAAPLSSAIAAPVRAGRSRQRKAAGNTQTSRCTTALRGPAAVHRAEVANQEIGRLRGGVVVDGRVVAFGAGGVVDAQYATVARPRFALHHRHHLGRLGPTYQSGNARHRRIAAAPSREGAGSPSYGMDAAPPRSTLERNDVKE